ncbi:hypothetical protein [Bradyrhizobium liaoningense]|uniref:hypothetical protein n=1 Tax=Bradyrhizobium liaoningense TaxID=43992 RepID=UPI001BAD1D46|nr:hypothetical protein [Bradyrhizobium liaoningense]MBR0817901.1 hypothetical protein [Bradyrhizobium liaoningense]
MDDDFVDDTIIFLVKRVIMPPGRWVLEQFGERRPSEMASLFTGLGFWAFVVFLVFALVLGW